MLAGTVVIDQERCKGCNLCTTVCPQHILQLDAEHLNAKGYHPAVLIENDDKHCTGCAICAIICPDACFTVLRQPARKAAS